jgi:hypothetical protein
MRAFVLVRVPAKRARWRRRATDLPSSFGGERVNQVASLSGRKGIKAL